MNTKNLPAEIRRIIDDWAQCPKDHKDHMEKMILLITTLALVESIIFTDTGHLSLASVKRQLALTHGIPDWYIEQAYKKATEE